MFSFIKEEKENYGVDGEIIHPKFLPLILNEGGAL